VIFYSLGHILQNISKYVLKARHVSFSSEVEMIMMKIIRR